MDNEDGSMSAMVMSALPVPDSRLTTVTSVPLEEQRTGEAAPHSAREPAAKKPRTSEDLHLMGLSMAATMVPRAPTRTGEEAGEGETGPTSEEDLHAAMSIATIRTVNPLSRGVSKDGASTTGADKIAAQPPPHYYPPFTAQQQPASAATMNGGLAIASQR